MIDFETLTDPEKAALDWQIERARIAHCVRNRECERVGLAEQHPEQFRRQLLLAILDAPDARAKIDGFVMAYASYLLQYSRPESAAGSSLGRYH